MAGFVALLEQPIPDLFDHLKDTAAIMDVELAAHPYAKSLLLDCTIRHPCAACSIQGSAIKEFAVGRADKQKRERYPGNAGNR